MGADWTTTWHDISHMDVTAGEKALRTVLVYFGLVVLLRLAGKRVLSQLNTFDLVVVLLLSNVVQNAIIGDDNSVSGGLLGALVLVAVNALWERAATASEGITRVVAGSPTALVKDGKPLREHIIRLGLRVDEVKAALHRQGADRVEDVEVAQLEPGGSITMELTKDAETASYGELRKAVGELRAHLDDRLAALEASLRQKP